MGFVDAPFPPALEDGIRAFYQELGNGDDSLPVAVRSSATAEDLPDASFAGSTRNVLKRSRN